jgi:hypothetical protein
MEKEEKMHSEKMSDKEFKLERAVECDEDEARRVLRKLDVR